MKLHWQDTEVHRGKYRQVKREVDLVFIERETVYVVPRPKSGAMSAVDEHHPIFEKLDPKTWERPHYTVVILRVRGRKGIISGVSRFSAAEGETFDYSKGRKLALSRALLQAFPGKHSSARRKAWYSYRLQTEMEAVKKEEHREWAKGESAQHRERMTTLDLMMKALEAPRANQYWGATHGGTVKDGVVWCEVHQQEYSTCKAKEVKPDGDPHAG